MGLTTRVTSSECSDDINFVTLTTAHAEQSGSYEANKDRETQNETINTIEGELEFDEYSEKAGLIHSETADHMLRKLENSPSIDTHESRELRMHRVSHVDNLSDHNVFDELVDDILTSGYKISSKVASLGQRHERTQNKLLSGSIVPVNGTTACTTSDIRGMEITPKTSLMRQVVRKRSTIKAPNQMLVPKENIRISVPKASMKGRAKQKRTIIKASNQILTPKASIGISVPSDVTFVETEKEPTSPVVEQSSRDKVLQGTDMSSMIKTPLSYVHQSPITCNKAKSLSVCTPESMKRSRSGRLIVPRLDPGSQNIIYGPDGIVAITNFEVHFSQESNSEPPSKRRKRSRRLSQDHNRLLTF